jgi:hypothetical protein
MEARRQWEAGEARRLDPPRLLLVHTQSNALALVEAGPGAAASYAGRARVLPSRALLALRHGETLLQASVCVCVCVGGGGRLAAVLPSWGGWGQLDGRAASLPAAHHHVPLAFNCARRAPPSPLLPLAGCVAGAGARRRQLPLGQRGRGQRRGGRRRRADLPAAAAAERAPGGAGLRGAARRRGPAPQLPLGGARPAGQHQRGAGGLEANWPTCAAGTVGGRAGAALCPGARFPWA